MRQRGLVPAGNGRPLFRGRLHHYFGHFPDFRSGDEIRVARPVRIRIWVGNSGRAERLRRPLNNSVPIWGDHLLGVALSLCPQDASGRRGAPRTTPTLCRRQGGAFLGQDSGSWGRSDDLGRVWRGSGGGGGGVITGCPLAMVDTHPIDLRTCSLSIGGPRPLTPAFLCWIVNRGPEPRGPWHQPFFPLVCAGPGAAPQGRPPPSPGEQGPARSVVGNSQYSISGPPLAISWELNPQRNPWAEAWGGIFLGFPQQFPGFYPGDMIEFGVGCASR
jgi:hypothetical protein